MKTYDVVLKYDWTSSPPGSQFRKDAPKILMRSYKINSNQIMTAFRGYVSLTANYSGDADTFYDSMYSGATSPEDNFIFPYFSNGIRGFSNTFGDTFQSGVGGSGGILNDLNEGTKQFVGGFSEFVNMASKSDNPGTYIETPMFYQFEKNDSPIEVSFVLSNTINSGSHTANLELLTHLTRINRPLRKTSISVEPPQIYKIILPGLRFIRWAYCNNFNAEMIGTKREINGVIVPEAYMITMSFQSLTLEHAGFLDKVMNKNI